MGVGEITLEISVGNIDIVNGLIDVYIDGGYYEELDIYDMLEEELGEEQYRLIRELASRFQ